MKQFAAATVLLTVLFVFSGGCGGGSSESGGSENGGDSAEVTADSPEILAGEIADNYLQCMDKLQEMLADRPDPETLKPMLEDLIREYKDIFLGIGYRVDMNDSLTVNEIGRLVMNRLYGRDIQWMTDASMYYHSLDPQISSMIGELNIISQYAFFELLEDQRPAEAESLGIAD